MAKQQETNLPGERQRGKPYLWRTILCKQATMYADTWTALSRAIVRDLVDISAYRRSKTVMVYMSFDSELRTDGFVRHVLDQGKTLVLPRVNRAPRRLDIYRVRDLIRDLGAGTWGILEPRPDRCVPVESDAIDFVLVPGPAFDVQGECLRYERILR